MTVDLGWRARRAAAIVEIEEISMACDSEDAREAHETLLNWVLEPDEQRDETIMLREVLAERLTALLDGLNWQDEASHMALDDAARALSQVITKQGKTRQVLRRLIGQDMSHGPDR